MISEIFVRTGVNAAGVSAVALARTFLASEAEKWKGGCVHPIGLTAVMEEEDELVCTVCGCAFGHYPHHPLVLTSVLLSGNSCIVASIAAGSLDSVI